MAATGAIISGSAALALLHHQVFSPHDLDFYVLQDGYVSLLEFVQHHGYRTEANCGIPVACEKDAAPVQRLVHLQSKKEIKIVTILAQHVVQGITNFHSSLVMNYIAWYGIVSLYPEWTLAKKGLIVKDTSKTLQCFEKYKTRGFTVDRNNTVLDDTDYEHWCEMTPDCPNTCRNLLDGYCFFVSFVDLDGDLEEFE